MIIEGDARRGEKQTIATRQRIPNTAIFLKRTAIEFLQIVFSLREDYRYDPDDTITGIQIADSYAADLTSVNVRPAIIATRGPISYRNLGLGGGAVSFRNMKTGSHEYTDLITGSLSFNIFSREGIEAEQLAHLVFSSFKFFRPDLQKYGYFTIQNLSMGGASLIEQEGADDVTYAVPVSMTASVVDKAVNEEIVGRTLKKVVTQVIANF